MVHSNRPVRVLGGLIAMLPAILACTKYFPGGGPDDVEDGPCTGLCNSYESCPSSDSCTAGYPWGVMWCTCFGWNVNCSLYSGGWTDSNGCCYGGAYYGLGSQITVQACTTGGGCIGYWVPI